MNNRKPRTVGRHTVDIGSFPDTLDISDDGLRAGYRKRH